VGVVARRLEALAAETAAAPAVAAMVVMMALLSRWAKDETRRIRLGRETRGVE